ncbi:hypothetical protein QEN19_001474 [Hanseniaspora menglaensis]
MASTEAFEQHFLKLRKDLKQAMLAKDAVSKNSVRNMISDIKNMQIELRAKNLIEDEFAIASLYKKMIKQRNESVADFTQNKRDDLAEKENQDILIIKKYLGELPVASDEAIEVKAKDLLLSLKNVESLKINDVFKQVDISKAAKEIRASPNQIKGAIVKIFKEITCN